MTTHVSPRSSTQPDPRLRRRARRLGWMAAAPALALAAALIGGMGPAAGGDEDKLLFADARLIIEFNDTDQDVGIQLFVDGEPWKLLRAYDPKGRKILEIKGTRSLRTQGLTELFFESSEPSLDEVPLSEFLKRFPEGVYELEGVTIDGEEIEGEAIFTHAIPAGPVLLSPEEDELQDPQETVVEWEAVPDPPGSAIKAYQVVVTELIAVLPKRSFSVFVPASVTSVTVPPEYLRPGAEYEFEVLAIEEGGNQTLSASSFSIEP